MNRGESFESVILQKKTGGGSHFILFKDSIHKTSYIINDNDFDRFIAFVIF